MYNNYIYIAVMALVSYTIRILPLTLIRKPIKNQFIQSFLYYVPYVTLSVMTFPAIVHATQSPVSGALALAFSGIGKPEPLKNNFSGFWSRRIDDVNRLVYRINDGQIEIIQCKGHYE